jgi:6-phosphogluconolactonase
LIFTITTGAVDPQSIAVDPAGKFAYVMNAGCNGGVGGYVSMYTINPTTGALASIGPPVFTYDIGSYPNFVTVAPSGKFVYVTNSGNVYAPDDGSVAMYSIDATTGALTSIGTIAAGSTPTSIAIHPSGNFAYVTNSASNDVSMYSIDSATGALTLIGTIGT